MSKSADAAPRQTVSFVTHHLVPRSIIAFVGLSIASALACPIVSLLEVGGLLASGFMAVLIIICAVVLMATRMINVRIASAVVAGSEKAMVSITKRWPLED